MKKLFTFIFMLSAMCTLVYAEDFVFDKEAVKQEIDNAIKTEVADNTQLKSSDDNSLPGLVNVIFFHQEVFNAPSKYSEGNKLVENRNKECIAIVIDDAWAVASKKCLLSKGEKMEPIPGTVERSNASNFRVIFSGKTYNADSYAVGNVFLLRVVNKDGKPVFASAPKANLAFAKSADISEFINYFKDGIFEVNRTNKHKAGHDDGQHNAFEDDFHSYYGVDRTTYEKEIEEIYKDNKTNNMLAQVSSTLFYPKLLRAGDPLFYVENGQKYLLGFANATNLWDNFDGTRTDKVILLTYPDTRLIWEKVNSIDPKAAKRIHDNILVK